MSLWKTSILDVYRRASWPYRAWWLKRAVARRMAPLTILFYHRVADRDPVPWTITNAQFKAHMDWLQPRFDMISLDELQRRLRGGQNTRPAVHITFDDGYAENCEYALPLLIERHIPCTYFVTLENVVQQKPFPHDVRLGKSLPVNTVADLRELADRGIVIGAHTRTHPDLGQICDEDVLCDEVIVSRRELAQLLGRAVRYFAFPFGLHANLNRRVFEMARQDGLEAVCSAYGGYNFPGDDVFHLQRWHGDPELSRIKNVASVDPRKLNVPRYQYC